MHIVSSHVVSSGDVALFSQPLGRVTSCIVGFSISMACTCCDDVAFCVHYYVGQ